jgi:TP901 family phage tail tape measure protein
LTDRSVSIALIANVQGYVAGIKTAQAATSKFTAEVAASAKKQQALRELGNAAGIMGGVAAAGFFLAVKAAATFDQAISRVAATGDDARTNIGALRQAALDFGQSTKFSATEAADAVTELIKAGVSAQDVLGGGLKGSLDLAAAGELDVATAANIAATAMSQFSLSGADVPRIADLLAAAAGKAQGEVTDMAESLKYVGPIAAQMGVSIEETVGTIAELANQGILGSQAGTSLRGMLSSLTSPSAAAAEEMKKLGISMYDAQGQFIGFDGAAGQLQAHMGDLTNAERDQALGRIFGNQQITAARILYAGGAADVQKWTDKVTDQGYATETAATKMDNLIGDLEQLKGAFETALIGTGSGANTPLREMVQLLTDLINAYNALPGPVKNGALALAGLTAVIGLSAFAASRAVLAYGNFKTNLSTLGLSASTASKQMMAARAGALGLGLALMALNSNVSETHQTMKSLLSVASGAAIGFSVAGPWGAAIGAGAGLLQVFASGNRDAAGDVAALTSTLDAQTGAITDNSREWAANQLANAGLIDDVTKLGLSAADVTNAMLGQADAIALVNAAIDEQVSLYGATTEGEARSSASRREFSASADAVREIIGQTNGDVTAAAEKFRFMSAASDGAAGGLDGVGSSADSAATQIEDMNASLERMNALLSKRSTVRDFEAALDDANKALKENGKGLSETTEKGRANAAALDNIASSAIEVAKGIDDINARRKFLQGAQADYAAMAEKMGLSAEQAQNLAARIFDIPTKRDVRITVQSQEAEAAAKRVAIYLASLSDKTITVHLNTVQTHYDVAGGGGHSAPGSAEGGTVRGGIPGKDSVLSWLMPGEEVIKTSAAERHRPLLKLINAERFAGGGTAGEAADNMAAFLKAIAHFNIRSGAGRSGVQSEVSALVDAMKAVVGKDSPLLGRMQELGGRVVEAAGKFEKASDKLDKLQSDARQFAQSVATAFQHDAFTGSAEMSLLQLRADRNDALKARRDLRQARRHGLSGPLAQMIAASGNTLLASEVGDMSRREIRQYERLYRRRQQVTRGIGQDASDAAFGKQISHQIKVTEHLDKTMVKLERTMQHLGNDVRDGAHKGTKDGQEGRQRHHAVKRRAG